jgi:hypothetical protein
MGPVRYLVSLALVIGLATPALAQLGGGLAGALDRQQQQQTLQQQEIRREGQLQRQDLQRQQDLLRLQQQLERQVAPAAPVGRCTTIGFTCD